METDNLVRTMDSIELHYKAVGREAAPPAGSGGAGATSQPLKELTNSTPDELYHNQHSVDRSQVT